jgi:predicted flap endonuclease-1-like 5' DNA nuclease
MNQTSDYTFLTASLEIIILSVLAFLLGMLLCWLLRKMGLCCGGHSTGHREAYDVKAGGYTSDINSLLRSRETPDSNTASRSTFGNAAAGIAGGISDVTAAATGLMGGIAGIAHLGDGRKDDLKKLEGIGPKIEQLLNTAGIKNFEQLASLTPDVIKPVLDAAGAQFKMHDPKSWPYQAELAAKGEWNRLKEYQNLLIGGQEE